MIERLSGQDISSLSYEALGWPQDIGAIAIADATTLQDADGRFRVELVRQAIAARLHLVPSLRKVVLRPGRGLGRPIWVDAPAFDITNHVRVYPLGDDADEDDLLRACELLRRTRLDPARPLWQLWLLPGLRDGRVGVFVRLHHVIADGVAGVALIGSLLQTQADAWIAPAPAWVPRPAPTRRELRLDMAARRARRTKQLVDRVAHPVRALGNVAGTARTLRDMFATPRVPSTSLNRPIGADRSLAVVRGCLDTARVAAHREQATVNDLILATVAGALRDLLHSRGEPVDGLVLRAAIPVSLHPGASGPARGNLDSGMNVPLPARVADPIARLRLVRQQTATLKAKDKPPMFTGFMASELVQKTVLRLMNHQHIVNTYIADVPGPPAPLYLAGARLLEVFPLVPIIGNVTVGIGVLSYAGQLNFTVVADHDTWPDLPVFARALQHAYDELCQPAHHMAGGQ